MLKRFTCSTTVIEGTRYGAMQRDPEGAYVYHSDYARLRAAVEEFLGRRDLGLIEARGVACARLREALDGADNKGEKV